VPVVAQGGASSHRPPPPVSPTYAAIAISTGSEIARSTSSGSSIGSATGIAPRIMIDALLGLSGGVPTVFNTANGDLPGRIVTDVPVTLGPVGVSGVKVAVGFIGHEADDALLGQSFLAKFEVLLESDRMTLRKRVQQPR